MRVSVIIPNYNYGAFIGGTISSLLAQSVLPDEIIVVDDGSTDHSRDVISSFGDKVIALYQENAGQAAALSRGFSVATGDIVCLLDSDDFFHPDKIKKLKELYAENPRAGWVFHDLSIVEGAAVPQDFPPLEIAAGGIVFVDERQNMSRGTMSYDAPATSGLTFRRDFIAPLFPLPVADSIYISDHYIKFYALAMGAGLHVKAPLGGQLIHGENLYTGKKKLSTRGRIFTNTAYALREKCPDVSAFCMSIMEEGMACLRAAGVAADGAEIYKKFIETMSPLSVLIMELKIFLKTKRALKKIS